MQIISKIIQGITELHKYNLIHSDIKLANILANFNLDSITVYDFGISKICRETSNTKQVGYSLRYSPLE